MCQDASFWVGPFVYSCAEATGRIPVLSSGSTRTLNVLLCSILTNAILCSVPPFSWNQYVCLQWSALSWPIDHTGIYSQTYEHCPLSNLIQMSAATFINCMKKSMKKNVSHLIHHDKHFYIECCNDCNINIKLEKQCCSGSGQVMEIFYWCKVDTSLKKKYISDSPFGAIGFHPLIKQHSGSGAAVP